MVVTIQIWKNLPSSFNGVEKAIAAVVRKGETSIDEPQLRETEAMRLYQRFPDIQDHLSAFERRRMCYCCGCICVLCTSTIVHTPGHPTIQSPKLT